jgi:hypothetical protein
MEDKSCCDFSMISIEHEDALVSRLEGVQQAIALLKTIILPEPAGSVSWSV